MQPVERGVFWHRQLAFLNADRGCARCCIEGVNFDNISIRFVWRSRKRAGADNFFIKLAFDSMGHLRGGHVKATVVALAASGLFSFVNYQCGYHWLRHQFLNEAGKIYPRTRQCGPGCLVNQRSVDATGHWRSGFSHFEFTGVSYLELIKHAFLPTVISYVALISIVHLEALKLGLKGLPRTSVAGSLLQN